MNVRDIMTPTIETLTEEDTVLMAAQRMRDVDVGALPVQDDRNRMTGILTDRDIVIRAVANGYDPATCRVREVMSAGVLSCSGAWTVEEAAAIMEREQIRRLVVVDDDNKAVGILALGDIAVKSPMREVAGEAVEQISKPAQPATLP